MKTNGFTLIEVIIAIVMVSIAALIMISFLDTGLTRSGDPLIVLDDNYTALKAIEIINSDYRTKLEQNAAQPMDIYVGNDLSSTFSGLTGIAVTGEYINFSAPDANRKVTEIASSASVYVKITARKNNSKLVTILGN